MKYEILIVTLNEVIFTLEKNMKKKKIEINTNIILVSEIIYFRSFSLNA